MSVLYRHRLPPFGGFYFLKPLHVMHSTKRLTLGRREACKGKVTFSPRGLAPDFTDKKTCNRLQVWVRAEKMCYNSVVMDRIFRLKGHTMYKKHEVYTAWNLCTDHELHLSSGKIVTIRTWRKRCPVCKDVFHARNRKMRYCSTACKQKAYRRRKEQKRQEALERFLDNNFPF
jgi:hypothetical protein